MATTTTFYGLYLPATGDGAGNGQQWGPQVNNNFTVIDTTMAGLVTKVNPRTTGTYQHGTSPNYFELESNGVPVLHGTAQVWNDWNLSISGAKVPAAGAPAWNTMVGTLEAYQFAVNDSVMMESQEFLHDWAEGTDLHFHLHWATGGLNNATPRGVKWEIEYTYANTDFSGAAAYQFPVTTTVSLEPTIPANAPALSHIGTAIATVTPTGMKVGAQLLMRLKRVAAVGTAPAANPFALSLGIHYQQDTPGSRSIATK